MLLKILLLSVGLTLIGCNSNSDKKPATQAELEELEVKVEAELSKIDTSKAAKAKVVAIPPRPSDSTKCAPASANAGEDFDTFMKRCAPGVMKCHLAQGEAMNADLQKKVGRTCASVAPTPGE